MLYSLEIDNTIAIDTKHFAQTIKQAISLGVPDEAIEKIRSHHKMLGFKETGKQRYVSTLAPLPGAAEALQELAREGNIAYMTNRPAREATELREWLRTHGFPEPEQTYHCRQLVDKYRALHTVAAGDRITAIGYRVEQCIKAFERLCRTRPRLAYELVGKIEIVGIGYREIPRCPTNRSFAISVLPSWSQDEFRKWRQRWEEREQIL